MTRMLKILLTISRNQQEEEAAAEEQNLARSSSPFSKGNHTHFGTSEILHAILDCV
jgi:hypothetical protein